MNNEYIYAYIYMFLLLIFRNSRDIRIKHFNCIYV